MVLLALWAGYRLWDYYMDAPWIRDGHVRADVVPVAPDVSGFVSEVLVRDNEQVQRGDVLFRIDRARYAIVASAVLTAIDLHRFTIIDFRALAALSIIQPTITINFYLAYLAKCRELAEEK